MTDMHGLIQVTEMHGVTKTARESITTLITRMTGRDEMTFDFYREWNGGWRVSVKVSGISAPIDFILFHTPQGGLLAMPSSLPEVWRLNRGVAASDGSVWTIDDQGFFVPFSKT